MSSNYRMDTHKKILLLGCITCAAICFTGTSEAAPSWDGIGPSGSDQFLVEIAPFDPQTLYSLSHHSIHVSTNGADTWTAIHDVTMNRGSFLGIGFPDNDREHLVVSSTKGGVYETFTGGASWQLLRTGLLTATPGGEESGTIASMVTRPNGDVIAGVSTTNEPSSWVYALARGGTSWIPQGTGMGLVIPRDALANVPTVLLSVDADTNLWGMLYGGGVFRWDADTNAWQNRNGNLPAAALRSTFLCHDLTRPGMMLLGTEADWIYETLDGGTSWTRATLPAGLQDLEDAGTSLPLVYMIACDPANPDVMLVRANDWLRSLEVVLFNAANKQTNGAATYVTLDGGTNWMARNHYPLRMAFDASSGTVSGGAPPFSGVTRTRRAYMTSVSVESFLRSTNGGESFVPSDDGIHTYFCNALHWSTSFDDEPGLFVGGEEGISHFATGSSQWTNVQAVADYMYVWSIATDHSNTSNVLYSTGHPAWNFTDQMGIYRLTPASFHDPNRRPGDHQLLSGTGVWRVVTTPSLPNTIYASSQEHGVLISEDGGTTWTNRNQGLALPCSVTDLELDDGGQLLYAAVRTSSGDLLADPPEIWWVLPSETGGVYRINSTNSHWEFMPGLTNAVLDLEKGSTPSGGTNLYAATSLGIYVSTNEVSWAPLLAPAGLTVYDLLVHPTNNSHLYAATTAGILRSTDAGVNWHEVSDGLTLKTVQTIVLDEQTDTLYAGTLGNSVFRLALPSNPSPELVCSPTNLYFGGVPQGFSKVLSAVITNIGFAPLVITNVLIDNPTFSLRSPPVLPRSLPVGKTLQVALVFSPTNGLTETGSVIVVSNDPDSPHVVPLMGQGYAESGGISVNVSPEHATWTAITSWGDAMSYSGDVSFAAIPIGTYTIQWDVVEGYYAPTNAPVTAVVAVDSTQQVVGAYLPLGLDSDGDGMPDWQEYVAGTDPSSGTSRFVISSADLGGADNTNYVIAWPSVSNRYYAIFQTTSLLMDFDPLVTNISATPPLNVHTASLLNASHFYRITVKKAP